jgi:hypothetical protein
MIGTRERCLALNELADSSEDTITTEGGEPVAQCELERGHAGAYQVSTSSGEPFTWTE